MLSIWSKKVLPIGHSLHWMHLRAGTLFGPDSSRTRISGQEAFPSKGRDCEKKETSCTLETTIIEINFIAGTYFCEKSGCEEITSHMLLPEQSALCCVGASALWFFSSQKSSTWQQEVVKRILLRFPLFLLSVLIANSFGETFVEGFL